jgi:phenylpropionate dioxygenase-like ring-hydroxylating dioxygenase large terminal subunit
VVLDLASLMGPGWVDGKIYTDEAIFQAERERIFRRSWLYVAHASEVPAPGDYQRRELAGEPVIVVRDRDERIRVLLNRCRHRGNLVCQHAAGNAQFFRCQYHGWTYSNRGDLVGVPYPQSYGEGFDRATMGLTEMPAVDMYRGFIFASFDPGVAPLLEHMGAAWELIDLFVDQSPVGEIRVQAGVQRAEYRGNWKFVGMDGYHTNFVHKSVDMIQHAHWTPPAQKEKRRAEREVDLAPLEFGKSPDKLGNRSQDLGHGHVHINNSPQRLAKADQTLAEVAATPAGKEYLASMEERYGAERARTLIAAPDPHLGFFPNLQIIGVLIRVIEPVSAGRTVIAQYPALLESVPAEINEQRIRKYEWFFSPAGFGTPDDYEVFERNQTGLTAAVQPRVDLSRGLGREVDRLDGTTEGAYTDEVPQRGQLARWAQLMTDTAASSTGAGS